MRSAPSAQRLSSYRSRNSRSSHGIRPRRSGRDFDAILCSGRIMTQMDWGEAQDFVRFGAVGGDHVDDCDYYILIAPQNVVGNTIMTGLGDMVRVESQPSVRP